jgi:hypothetical protein
MGVFDGATKVKRAVPDPETDHTLPPGGALSWGAVPSAGGLAGTTGADCKLVHGDRWQEIDGSMTENFKNDVKTRIIQDEKHAVLGNQVLSVIGNVTATIHGATTTLNSGPVDRTYVSDTIEQFSSAHHQEEKQGLYEWKYFNGEINILHQSTEGIRLELTEVGCALQDYKCEVVNMETQVKELKNGVKGLHSEVNGFSDFISALHTELSGAQAKGRGIEAKAGPDVQGPPTSLGAN